MPRILEATWGTARIAPAAKQRITPVGADRGVGIVYLRSSVARAPPRPLNGITFYRLTMTLIETHPGESDAELRAVTDGILQTLNPGKPNWWHPYELRGTYRRDGKVFREFFCIAGSVQIWLWKLASENRTREVLMLEDDSAERRAG